MYFILYRKMLGTRFSIANGRNEFRVGPLSERFLYFISNCYFLNLKVILVYMRKGIIKSYIYATSGPVFEYEDLKIGPKSENSQHK